MAKRRTFVLLFTSVAFAVGAAWVANNWLLSKQQVNSKRAVQTDQVQVVVASLDIPHGQKLETRHLKLTYVPETLAPADSYRSLTEVEGMVATQAILPGDVIRKGRVAEHLQGATLASLIEPNMRAFTVRVNDVVGVAGFLLPGNRVDVIATRKISNSSQRVSSKTVLRNIKVLAVDQTARSEKNDPVVVRAVTLEVSPTEAEALAKARDEGKLQLTLRNPNDEEIVMRSPQAVPLPVMVPVSTAAPEAEPVVAKPKRQPVRSYPSSNVVVIKGTNWQKKNVP